MYQRNAWLTVVISVTLSLVFGVDSARALPSDQTMDYRIHATPTDPESDVVFVVRLELVADQRIHGQGSEGRIGWEVIEVRFTQPGYGGNPDIVWVEDSPVVDTFDGLWWLDHADLGNPDTLEFAIPPSLMGTAPPDDPAEDDLDYDFVGVEYTPPTPPAAPPYDNTVGLTYSFVRTMAEDPIKEGEDEIAESDGVNDPS